MKKSFLIQVMQVIPLCLILGSASLGLPALFGYTNVEELVERSLSLYLYAPDQTLTCAYLL
ncbi:MAG: hypothetical protein Q4E62_10355, partial [Sutterellaceae bacterium]|nr:hypothetical protein [Sutterellaceae bacterium]